MRACCGPRAPPESQSGGRRLIGFWPLAAHLATLAALFVRFVDPEAARAPRHLVASAADLALVRRHHALFYLLLLAAPVEWWLHGRPAAAWQLAGAALAAAGVHGYRRAGRALGDQLGPLVAPVEPARLIDRGWYGRIRHPMYLAELALAFGLPLVLAARWTLALSGLFLAAVVHRIEIEERALAARCPEYAAYASRTSRLVPHVY
ncbi:MAG: isoprenylcysteine carboxylmethyltransferase family protein [Deltaproteobacteria bacterium]|nr:isoprenylcysteine carboxylmethyltransferase family protein [Deltaproteobacteria bacterium]